MSASTSASAVSNFTGLFQSAVSLAEAALFCVLGQKSANGGTFRNLHDFILFSSHLQTKINQQRNPSRSARPLRGALFVIEVSHLTKKYGHRLAVEDVSFAVADGGICGLLGPNGAGKSTIMNILTGYLSATSGQVTVAGYPLPEEADAAKKCVGYLPEQPPLYPEMTVQEYLDFAAELKGVKKAERKEQVRSAARRTGLEKVLPRLIRSLSKGYRQRVGIAQALLGSPKLIILDEPTVGLDPAQVIEIRKLIRELGQAHTVILSSHILSEVQAVCQQVLILSKGRLAASGSLQELTADGRSLEEVFLELTGGETEESTGEEDE